MDGSAVIANFVPALIVPATTFRWSVFHSFKPAREFGAGVVWLLQNEAPSILVSRLVDVVEDAREYVILISL